MAIKGLHKGQTCVQVINKTYNGGSVLKFFHSLPIQLETQNANAYLTCNIFKLYDPIWYRRSECFIALTAISFEIHVLQFVI